MIRKFASALALSTLLALTACGGGGQEPNQEPEVQAPHPPETIDLMSYGISTFDSAGNLVMSAQAPTLHFLGKASYVGMQAVAGLAPNMPQAHVYRITAPAGAPLPIVQMTAGSTTFVEPPTLQNVGGTTWDIIIRSNATPGSLSIYCFGVLDMGTQPAEAWGVRVLGPDGSPYFDSTRKPLVIKQAVQLQAGELPSTRVIATGTVLTSDAFTPPSHPFGLFVHVPGYVASISGQAGNGAWTTALTAGTSSINRVIGYQYWGTLSGGGSIANRSAWSAARVLVVDLSPYQ